MITKTDFESKNCQTGRGGWTLKELQDICISFNLSFNTRNNKDDLCKIIKGYFQNTPVNTLANVNYKELLEKYQVDYTDPNNFIYKNHEKNIDEYKNADGTWNYTSIYELYYKVFNEKIIVCESLGITSMPVYPNMEEFGGENNELTSFPIQPNMKLFVGDKNRLTSFPVQPKMVQFHGDNNQLTSFPVQPKMVQFHGDNNQLTSFPMQPKMVQFHGDNNQLTSFPVQPIMEEFHGNKNQFTSFPVQPEMKEFFGIDNQLTTFPVQPNMESFWGDRNQLVSFEIQPKIQEFSGNNNQITSFPVQPEMQMFYGNNNQLISFPVQPKMKTFYGKNNQLISFPVQPKMKNFDIIEFLKTQRKPELKFKKLFKDISQIENCDSDNIEIEYLNELNKQFNTTFTKENICEELQMYFKEKEDVKQVVLPKCTNDSTILLTDLKDVPSLFFYNTEINGKMFCGDIRELIEIKNNKNPWTNEEFKNNEMQQIISKIDKLKLLLENLNDIDEEEVVNENINSTIRRAMSNVLEKLRYPNQVNNYVNAKLRQVNNFINVLKEENVISENDSVKINKITNIENKKLALANLLYIKLENTTEYVEMSGIRISSMSVVLEELYNRIFN
jgi:hypothetical protein